MCTYSATRPARKRFSAPSPSGKEREGPQGFGSLFLILLDDPAAPVAREEGPESRQPVRLSLPLKVEVLPGYALAAGASNRS